MTVTKGDRFQGIGENAVLLEATGEMSRDRYLMKNLSWPKNGAAALHAFSESELTNGVTCKRVSREHIIHPFVYEAMKRFGESKTIRKQFVDCLNMVYLACNDGVQDEILEAMRRLPEDLKAKLQDKQ